MNVLQEFVQDTVVSNDAHWAWQNYKAVVLSLQRRFGCRSLLEVGGGRSPLIDEQEYGCLGIKYAVNDISLAELELAPHWPMKVCFDICSPPLSLDSSYDLIFSKMVFEHIPDANAAYRAVYNLLSPGGICLAFFPTLYCLPFVVNYLSPEMLSEKLQRSLDPRENPKFPAYYSWCRSTEYLHRKLKMIGFRQVEISGFYGHAYYRTIPVVRNLHSKWTELARAKDWRLMSSFAFAFAQK
jgi:SAM-dependent methyltransferase